VHENVDAAVRGEQLVPQRGDGADVQQIQAARLGRAAIDARLGGRLVGRGLGRLEPMIEDHDVEPRLRERRRGSRTRTAGTGDDGDWTGRHAVSPAVEAMVSDSLR
jgi:hypothetical protein